MWSVACVAFLGEFSATICISWVSVCLDFEVMNICVSKLTVFCGSAAAFFTPLQRIVRASLPSAQMYTWRSPEWLFLIFFR